MNKVILTGRLTADPELRQTVGGISSCRFTVAVNRKYADKTTGERQADFISCTAWRQTAEFISRYFSKGKMIVIEGTLRNNNYQDRKYADVMHYTMDVVVENVEFAGDKSGAGEKPSGNSADKPNSQTEQLSYGSISDFEDILSDGDTPF